MAYSYMTHEYSGFPDTIAEKPHFKDIDDSVRDTVDRYMAHYAQGDYAGAAAVLKESGADLSDYTLTARAVNTLVEGLRNAQIYAVQKRQAIYVQEAEPQVPENSDVWIGGA